jgi:hypothetical protein
MKVFRFFINNNLISEKFLKAQRCQANTKQGNRCKRKCIIGYEYCYPHLKSNLKLKIKDSSIPNAGKGVFVDTGKPNNNVVFKKNDKICEYNGQPVSMDKIRQDYLNKTAPYAYRINSQNAIDGAGKRGVGTLINSNRGGQNNVCFTNDTRNKKVNIRATKNIKNKEELFIPYSSGYKFNNKDVYYYTKNYQKPRR